ncbi:hypothetical protein PPL_06944 [Heterostelium album PN500]|uniref:IPT/TIG domain-containing protein n=1 Tax=Heterostelium pallidum (strain ATCC 26659 / Pp 5 / PN500) TaxID=670386 RepID=D3BDZ1_HETP5|nr:hypothetical protein PPL_06944 [Heterostelium album PN500]EFA80122.1 hypothetical protein PPL_06944 [Heterostelium album PN500]|eukprot:XP_020432242.1 hypothetical protein PPL_06944 [Heterostelium album PN500]
MDIASFEERASIAEKLCQDLASKVALLEDQILIVNTVLLIMLPCIDNNRASSNNNTDLVSLDEHKRALKEIESLRQERDRNKYRINHLIRIFTLTYIFIITRTTLLINRYKQIKIRHFSWINSNAINSINNNSNQQMEEPQKHQLSRFLNIFQYLGPVHLKTLNSFVQKPAATFVQQRGGSDDIGFDGDARQGQQAIFSLMALLDRATDEQVDSLLSVLLSQIRGQVDQSDLQRVHTIATSLRTDTAPHRRSHHQAHRCSHLDLPDRSLLARRAGSTTTHSQLLGHPPEAATTEINQHGLGFSIANQQICETLDLKPDEYYLATALRCLLQIDESSLISLFESFPKLQSLQLAQIAQIPFHSIYEVYELRANLCSLASAYQQPVLDFSYPLPDPQKKVELKIVEQPPEKAVYKRNIKPAPSVMFNADSKMLDGSYYIHAALVRCNNFQEEPTFMTGNKPIQVGSTKVVAFKKLKILVTSHQQGETLFCFRFDLRRYGSDPETNPNDFEHIANVDLPQVSEAIPLGGPACGGTRVAILGANFVDTPATRVRFDSVEVTPEYHSAGTLLCYSPEHAPGVVSVRVSNSPSHWSSSSAPYTYEDDSVINAANQVLPELTLPKSAFGLDFSTTFSAQFVIRGAGDSSLPSNSMAMRNQAPTSRFPNTNYSLDVRGYSILHYVATFSDIIPAEEARQMIAENLPVLNVQDKYGNTPLHWACIFNAMSMIKLLLSFGAAINMPNYQGIAPIHLAVAHSNLEIAKLLISAGANVHAADIDGVTPLHMAAAIKTASGVSTAILALLLSVGANIYATDDNGDSCLHNSVREENLDTTRLLLEYSKRLEYNQKVKIQELGGFDLSLEDSSLYGSTNEDGETPLHLAASIGSREILQLLLQYGADPSSTDVDGETPVDICNYKYPELLNEFKNRNNNQSSSSSSANKSINFNNNNQSSNQNNNRLDNINSNGNDDINSKKYFNFDCINKIKKDNYNQNNNNDNIDVIENNNNDKDNKINQNNCNLENNNNKNNENVNKEVVRNHEINKKLPSTLPKEEYSVPENPNIDKGYLQSSDQ